MWLRYEVICIQTSVAPDSSPNPNDDIVKAEKYGLNVMASAFLDTCTLTERKNSATLKSQDHNSREALIQACY
jgi:hypothetical protein